MNKAGLYLLLFFLFSISFHKLAQLPFEKFVEIYDHMLLRNILLVLGALVFVTLTILLSKRLKGLRTAYDKQICWSWIIAGILTLISYFFLMPYRAESMHFIQYAIMGALALKFIKEPFAALNLSFLLGALDELFQYLVGWSVYYDFNDLIFNFCGSFIGVLVVLTFQKNRDKSLNKAYKMVSFIYPINAAIGVLLLLGLLTDNICFFSDEPCLIHLCVWETGRLSMEFWHTLSWGDQWHRVRPIPGALVFILLPLTGIQLLWIRAKE